MRKLPRIPDLPLPHATTTTARPEFGMTSSTHLLADWKVQDFVKRTRQRHGIVPPEDAFGRDSNLAEHPPESFMPACRRVARTYWHRVFVRPLMAEWESSVAPWWLRLFAWFPLVLLRRYALRQMVLCFAIEEVVETSAYVIARHIVAGLYEVPAPINFPASAARVYEIGGDTPVLFAVILPYAHIDRALDQARMVYRDAFVPGKRQTFLTDFAQTAWLRFAGRQLAGDPDYDRAPWQYLSDLSSELSNSPPPPGAPPELPFPDPVAKSADTIRHNFDHFEAAKPNLWFYRKPNDP